MTHRGKKEDEGHNAHAAPINDQKQEDKIVIKINPQLEAHKSTDGTIIGKAEELVHALYRGGKRFKDILICWDEEHENIIVQTDVASESLIRLEVKYFLQAEKEKAQRDLLDAKIRLATIEELQDENRK